MVYVTAVATQGRYGGSQFVNTYYLTYIDGHKQNLGFREYKVRIPRLSRAAAQLEFTLPHGT